MYQHQSGSHSMPATGLALPMALSQGLLQRLFARRYHLHVRLLHVNLLRELVELSLGEAPSQTYSQGPWRLVLPLRDERVFVKSLP